MDPASDPPASVAFGPFRVLPHRRELLADGQPIKLGGRAFDVLMALIEASGAVVTKDELLSRAWPGRVVEESSLQAQIAALRAAFGADRDLIHTIAGRGYQFTGVIRINPLGEFVQSDGVERNASYIGPSFPDAASDARENHQDIYYSLLRQIE